MPILADPGAGQMGRGLISNIAWRQLGQSLRLSARELQIVQHVFDDHKEETIALALGISRHTVNTYVQRLYRKLGVSSRPQLIVRIIAAYPPSKPIDPPALGGSNVLDPHGGGISALSRDHLTVE